MGDDGDTKKVGILGMVVVGFFWVHGGIYGNESMLMAGPPLYVFILLGIVPFVYSLPIALIVAELSTAFPEDGGYVVWVQEACGKVVGSHHAYWVWVIYVVDAAIYPVLVSNYVDTMMPMGDTARGLFSTGIIIFVAAINLAGTDVMVKFSSVLALVSLLPTIFFTLYGLPKVKVSACLATEGELDWSLLVSWILWLYCGFFSLGTLAGATPAPTSPPLSLAAYCLSHPAMPSCPEPARSNGASCGVALAGELERPRRTFIVSLSILFPAVLLLNTLPLAVALGLDPEPSHYSAGYFNVLARRWARRWPPHAHPSRPAARAPHLAQGRVSRPPSADSPARGSTGASKSAPTSAWWAEQPHTMIGVHDNLYDDLYDDLYDVLLLLL